MKKKSNRDQVAYKDKFDGTQMEDYEDAADLRLPSPSERLPAY